MVKSIEQRLADVEAALAAHTRRMADVSSTEKKILHIVRQMARIKCARYYVGDNGLRYLCNPSEIDAFRIQLDIEISKLGVDLMGDD